MNYFALTIVGRDRAGIVSQVTEILYDQGCNIADSSCSILGGQFAMILILCHPEFTDRESFGTAFKPLEDSDLSVSLRVLKPGGRLLVLEFSKPTNQLFSKAYDAYSFSLLPMMGKLITNDAESYRYLAESIRMHPDQETLKGMMETAGFERVSYHNMTGGIVALHRGIKP